MNVLVGYATVHGSARAIAERTAVFLRHAGLAAEAKPVTEVEGADAYRAFVLGSAVHGQSWLQPAKDFARDHLDVLVPRPVPARCGSSASGCRRRCADRGGAWLPRRCR
ncbi:flavodoxin domain-containing protein [Streptomyces prasinus]|uniref:flavodoxin domain-containing protein n=1 Tax=Streptomyces prasinus TaxID=67345 RepID=UPI0033C9B86B